MNADRHAMRRAPSASAQPLAGIVTGLVLFLAGFFGPAPARAQLEPFGFLNPFAAEKDAAIKGFSSDRTPSFTTSTPDRLRWWNGQTFKGKLTAAARKEIAWQHPVFSRPARIGTAQIYDITLPTKEQKLPEDTFSVTMENGDRIFGQIEALDRNELLLTSALLGRIHLQTKSLQRIDRITGSGILWAGPRGLDSWQLRNSRDASHRAKTTWIEAENGSLRSISTQGEIRLPLEASTQRIEIILTLSAPSLRPGFALHLNSPGEPPITLCTWDNLLVLRQEHRFTALRPMEDNEHEITLRILRSPEDGGRGSVLTENGATLTRWGVASSGDDNSRPDNKSRDTRFLPSESGIGKRKSSEIRTRPLTSITLQNTGKELNLNLLRIRELKAAEVMARQTQPTRKKSDKETARYLLEFCGPAQHHTASEFPSIAQDNVLITSADGSTQSYKLQQLLSLRFPENSKSNEATEAALRARLQDGSIVQGTTPVAPPTDEAVIPLDISSSVEPVFVPITALKRLVWTNPPEAVDDPKSFDTLSIGRTTLSGTWKAEDGTALQWLPLGGVEPVPVAFPKTTSFSLTRAHKDDVTPKSSTSLIHLVDGQSIPGEILSMTREGNLIIDSEVLGRRDLPAAVVAAIQLPRKPLQTEGFSDSGWRFLTDKPDSDSFRSDKGGTVAIDPRHSWGHPAILAGQEISFDITRVKGHGGVKIGLFGNGSDHALPATYLLVANWDNRVYHGISAAEGEFKGAYLQTSISNNQPAHVRITWDTRNLQYFVNGSPGGSIALDPHKAPRSGTGLLFECCPIWGNDPGRSLVSSFSLTQAPGQTWVPAIAPEARERALFLPRFRRDDPPRHILVAGNGDLLSGSLESLTPTHLSFRSRLETVEIPRDLTSAIVWIQPDLEQEATPANKKSSPRTPWQRSPHPPAIPENHKNHHHWFSLRGGGLIHLDLEGFRDGLALGTSQALGPCEIPTSQIFKIRNRTPDPSPASNAFSGWQVRAAPEPLPEGSNSNEENSPLVGKRSPDLTLPLLDGDEFVLSEHRGKVVVLEFWASWSGPCVSSMPEMIKAFHSFEDYELVHLAVNQAEPASVVRKFLQGREWDHDLLVALDPDQAGARKFDVENLPVTILIDTDGKVAAVTSGHTSGTAQLLATKARKILSAAIRIN